jgi:hypothetical protein
MVFRIFHLFICFFNGVQEGYAVSDVQFRIDCLDAEFMILILDFGSQSSDSSSLPYRGRFRGGWMPNL